MLFSRYRLHLTSEINVLNYSFLVPVYKYVTAVISLIKIYLPTRKIYEFIQSTNRMNAPLIWDGRNIMEIIWLNLYEIV